MAGGMPKVPQPFIMVSSLYIQQMLCPGICMPPNCVFPLFRSTPTANLAQNNRLTFRGHGHKVNHTGKTKRSKRLTRFAQVSFHVSGSPGCSVLLAGSTWGFRSKPPTRGRLLKFGAFFPSGHRFGGHQFGWGWACPPLFRGFPN